jgi:hypothetical protein
MCIVNITARFLFNFAETQFGLYSMHALHVISVIENSIHKTSTQTSFVVYYLQLVLSNYSNKGFDVR